MRPICPHCTVRVAQPMNREGPNFCPQCQKLFYVPSARKIPTWILGVAVILFANVLMINP
jgi:hypothetical protein